MSASKVKTTHLVETNSLIQVRKTSTSRKACLCHRLTALCQQVAGQILRLQNIICLTKMFIIFSLVNVK
uniref:Uncharacterized protein n=1 Tax=Oryza brachyantha TaxID=4533 RepID=J3LD77_ORYBR